MPYVSKTDLAALQQQNESLSSELSQFEEMKPFLSLAAEIRDSITDLIENRDDLSAEQIGEMAYQRVLQAKANDARDEVAARFEQEHRRSLYERLLGEIATSEGDKISDQVRQKVETDPDLAQELRRSAREELAARAKDVVRSEITAEQEKIIAEEAERQIALDRLDVQLALERELDLNNPEVKDQLLPGDKVELFFGTGGKNRGRLVLTWTKDAKGHLGWVYSSCSETLVDNRGYTPSISEDKFVTIGCLNKDLESGTPVVEPGKLVVGLQLVVLQKADTKTRQIPLLYREGASYYNASYQPIMLTGSDFQTKDIEFTRA